MASNESEQAVRDGLAEFSMAGIIGEVDVPMRRTFVKGMAEINPAIIRESVEVLLRAGGRRYKLTLPEWVEACATIVDERRATAARQAKALLEDCPDCGGCGWTNAEGPNSVLRCNCHTRARQLVEAAGEPVKRLALPPMSEDVA